MSRQLVPPLCDTGAPSLGTEIPQCCHHPTSQSSGGSVSPVRFNVPTTMRFSVPTTIMFDVPTMIKSNVPTMILCWRTGSHYSTGARIHPPGTLMRQVYQNHPKSLTTWKKKNRAVGPSWLVVGPSSQPHGSSAVGTLQPLNKTRCQALTLHYSIFSTQKPLGSGGILQVTPWWPRESRLCSRQ